MSCGLSCGLFKPNLKLTVCLPSSSSTQLTMSPSVSSLIVNFNGISYGFEFKLEFCYRSLYL